MRVREANIPRPAPSSQSPEIRHTRYQIRCKGVFTAEAFILWGYPLLYSGGTPGIYSGGTRISTRASTRVYSTGTRVYPGIYPRILYGYPGIPGHLPEHTLRVSGYTRVPTRACCEVPPDTTTGVPGQIPGSLPEYTLGVLGYSPEYDHNNQVWYPGSPGYMLHTLPTHISWYVAIAFRE